MNKTHVLYSLGGGRGQHAEAGYFLILLSRKYTKKKIAHATLGLNERMVLPSIEKYSWIICLNKDKRQSESTILWIHYISKEQKCKVFMFV